MKKLFGLLLLLPCALARADYFGDFYLGDTVVMEFNTYKGTDGSDLQRTAAGTPSCVVDGSTTEITAGVTDTGTTAFDSSTGANKITVVATAANGYASGHDYVCGFRTSTLNGVTVSFLNAVSFSIENRTNSRYLVKDRGTLAAGSTNTTIQLGAKITTTGVWNGMLFRDLTTQETAVICASTNNGSTDTLSVAGLNTIPGSSDAYQIIWQTIPATCLNAVAGAGLPLVDSNGAVVVSKIGASGASAPSVTDNAGLSFNTLLNNNGSISAVTIGGLNGNVLQAANLTGLIDGTVSAKCALAMTLAALGNHYTSTSASAPYTTTFYDPTGGLPRIVASVTTTSRGTTLTCPP